MNCGYTKLMPILTTDSSIEQIVETDFYDTNALMSDTRDDRNERLLLQTDLYNSNNYFGTIDNKGTY